jgi:hypothetical protein
MARPHQELCEEIYQRHREVLDEVFLAIKQASPAHPESRSRTHFGTPLSNLFDARLISDEDVLYARYRDKEYTAQFARHADGTVVLLYNGNEYKSPSAAGQAIRQGPTAGWDFWRVRGRDGIEKGSLSELRRRLPDTSSSADLSDD